MNYLQSIIICFLCQLGKRNESLSIISEQRTHEYDFVEKHVINENIAQDWNNITGYKL